MHTSGSVMSYETLQQKIVTTIKDWCLVITTCEWKLTEMIDSYSIESQNLKFMIDSFN